ncbi:phospholipase DDHD1-like isoform X2 [Branchiostoma floridae x Branchiostoma japonicum]
MEYPSPGDQFGDRESGEGVWRPMVAMGRNYRQQAAFDDSDPYGLEMAQQYEDERPPAYNPEVIDLTESPVRQSPARPPRPPRPAVPPRPGLPSANTNVSTTQDVVTDLRPEEVRWFYETEEPGKKPQWEPFIGYDSLRIETKYRQVHFHQGNTPPEEKVDLIVVRGGVHEVCVATKHCYPIYWSGKPIKVLRGQWFHDGTWQPVEEDIAAQLETEHLGKWRGQRVPLHSSPTKQQTVLNVRFHDSHVDWYSPSEVFLFSDSKTSRGIRFVGKKLGISKATTSGTKLYRGYRYEAKMDDKPSDITHLVLVIHGIGQKMDTGRIIKCVADLRQAASKIQESHFPHLPDDQRVEFLPVEWRSGLTLDGGIVESITPDKIRGLREVLNASAMDIMYYMSPLYRNEITRCLQQELNRIYQEFCTRNPYFQPKGGKVSLLAHSLGSVITYDIMTGWSPIQQYDQYLSHEKTEHPDLVQVALGQEQLVSEVKRARQQLEDLEKKLMASSTYALSSRPPALRFDVENFFCLGSPLAVFLCLRGVRAQGVGTLEHIIPANLCKRLFNIFHPADPVAYRIEPLILRHYAGIQPQLIHNYSQSALPLYYDIKPVAFKKAKEQQMVDKGASTGQENGNGAGSGSSTPLESSSPLHTAEVADGKKDQESTLVQGALSLWSKWSGRSDAPKELQVLLEGELESGGPAVSFSSMDGLVDSTVSFPLAGYRYSDDDMLADTDAEDPSLPELEHRIDYVLREGRVESRYISAITSHTSYWVSRDVALFLLMHMYPPQAMKP